MPFGHSKTTWGSKKVNNFCPPPKLFTFWFFFFASKLLPKTQNVPKEGWPRKLQNFWFRGGSRIKSGILENPGQKSPEFWFQGGGVQKKNSGILERIPEFWNFYSHSAVKTKFWNSRILEFWNSGIFPEFQNFFLDPPPLKPEILDFAGPPLWNKIQKIQIFVPAPPN